MTTVYLVRHAEAEGNVFRRMQGQYDGDLTAKGLAQLEFLAKRFENIHIDTVWSSDLRRAVKTAKSIADPKGLAVKTHKGFREYSFGPYEDTPWGNALYYFPEQIEAFNFRPEDYTLEGAERYGDVEKRIRAAFDEVVSQCEGQTIVIAAHGTCLKTLMANLLGLDCKGAVSLGNSENTAVSCFEVENGTVREVFRNDASHLSEEMTTLGKQHWWKKGSLKEDNDLRLEKIDPGAWRELYIAWREEAWQNLYGTLDGCSAEYFWEEACLAWAEDNECLWMAYSEDEPAGLIQLSKDSDRRSPAGHISFCYLSPKYRCKGMGIQLIGHAVSHFRKRGFDKVRLCVSQKNAVACRFYQKMGFKMTGLTQGCFDMLAVMERPL
ncbi:MAG: GNAT family N-acetyltransferase [Oscillospiraceae bacterium]|nr:GNAT family N-acetyltransferase [Oscillospiraceae bacterium]